MPHVAVEAMGSVLATTKPDCLKIYFTALLASALNIGSRVCRGNVIFRLGPRALLWLHLYDSKGSHVKRFGWVFWLDSLGIAL